jgi:hypothetical protein
MKRMKILIGLLLISLAVACQTKPENTFTVPISFPAGIYIGTDTNLHLTWPTGSSVVYPSAGIPLSTGTAWGTSITNNSALWNTAGNWVNTNGATILGWGPHAGLYKLLASKVDYVSDVINKPAEIELAAAISSLPFISPPKKTTAEINALTPTDGDILYDKTLGVWKGYKNGVWRIFATTN